MDELSREEKDDRMVRLPKWGPVTVLCWIYTGLFNSAQAAWARRKKLEANGVEFPSLGKHQVKKAGRKTEVFYDGDVTIQNPVHEAWVGQKVCEVLGAEFFEYKINRDLRGKGWQSGKIIFDAWMPKLGLGFEVDRGKHGLKAIEKKMKQLGDRLVAWFTTSPERQNNMVNIASSNSWVGLLEGDTLINRDGQTVQINDFLCVIQTGHGVVTTPVNPAFDEVEEVSIDEGEMPMSVKPQRNSRVDPQLFAGQQAAQQQGPIQGELMPKQNTNLARVNQALQIAQMRAQEGLVIAAGVQGLLADINVTDEHMLETLARVAENCAIEVEFETEWCWSED